VIGEKFSLFTESDKSNEGRSISFLFYIGFGFIQSTT